ncbi:MULTISPECIES: TetR/AcrR family transcriptional regulator [Catenuloplanes]|uniref:DNA-binding transcriptional regulator YbjK n=1 Tax=Catenuloplanes niger TaxID=587534 RepID=A0AAE3ZKW2_9ACTN|nr:TetR family transcriptional regulator [Catenuloplanes niger]MDR7321181.1 DNA-binding transcriptional regulator YbjK [Catenuloplanes niger]
MAGTRRVANDPLRKQRILDAALVVIQQAGVHSTTHRRIAEAAGVPLGSLTYYFDGLPDIIEQAFRYLSDTMSGHYRAALAAAPDPAAACAAVTDLICGGDYTSPREQTLIYEMYAYANHDPAVAEIARAWVRRSHASLALHFDERACRAMDALIEGWSMHRVLEGAPLDRDMVLATITAIAARFPLRADARSGTIEGAQSRRTRSSR